MKDLEKGVVVCRCYPWADLISFLLTLSLVLFTELDWFVVLLVAIQGYLIGSAHTRDRNYFKRFIFWRK